ncbi:hypothetical protein Taro_042043 [Colocasia esculenta]|uniref:Uncharacterized protein n=1 Tax=Colocasia esculenta TaxID=4460 RepID=A0A843WMZ3_COLES|nr:hypothetical protein [Colocasia esculenta]
MNIPGSDGGGVDPLAICDADAEAVGGRGAEVVGPGRVEELLVAEELWNDHKKLTFFPFLSVATCTNCPLEIDQRCRPCERDGPICRVLRSCRNSKPVAF